MQKRTGAVVEKTRLASELAKVAVPILGAVVRTFTKTRSCKLKFMKAAADSAQ